MMPASQAHLDLADAAAELAEILAFISQWLPGPDHAQLGESFHRFIGTDSYDLAGLRTDLAQFTFPARSRRRRATVRHRRELIHRTNPCRSRATPGGR